MDDDGWYSGLLTHKMGAVKKLSKAPAILEKEVIYEKRKLSLSFLLTRTKLAF
jgi:hypothetical protein